MSCRLVEKEEDTFSTRMRVVVSTLVMFRYSKPHPSRPSTRRFQTTRCPLRYRCMGMHFSLLSSICRRRFLLSYATSGLVPSCPRLAALSACTLELVLPVNRGCFACDRQHEMKHMSKDANTRCLEAQLSHTALHQKDTSQTRANPDHRLHTEALSCVLQQHHWKPGLWTGHMGYGAHSPGS